MLTDCWYAIIFETANWKVQIENFIFPIFIFQLFRTFFETQFPAVTASTEGAKQSLEWRHVRGRMEACAAPHVQDKNALQAQARRPLTRGAH